MPYKWIGENVLGIPGVTARDLTEEEAEELGVLWILEGSPYYQYEEALKESGPIAEEVSDGSQRD